MIRVEREPASRLEDYANVSIAFEVRSVFEVRATAPDDENAFTLIERPVDEPYLKDYDAHVDDGPAGWTSRFDTSGWALFAAFDGRDRVGGAIGVMRSPDIEMFGDRTDLAILWDIRVAPAWRGKGVGALLLRAVEDWARGGGASTLEVETQDINVPACRFYERHGFRLGAVNPDAYPDLPNEMQLLWYKELGG